MKKFLLLALLSIAFGAVVQAESPSPLMKLPLIDSVKLGDFDIHKNNESRSFTLPKFQARPGYIPVLRCRMGTFKTTFGGCCFAAKINISGTDIGAQTAAGEVRMLGKHPRFEMTSTFRGRQFDYWAANDAKIDMPYGPSCDAIDNDSVTKDASVYLLDLRDVLSGNDSNTLTFTNIRPKRVPVLPLTLMVRDCEVGYISQDIVPAKPSTQVAYEPLQLTRQRGDLTLEVGKSGGFALKNGDNNILVVESRLSMDFNSKNTVLASDKRTNPADIKVQNLDYGKYGIKTVIKFSPEVTLIRKLKLNYEGMLQWQEEWRNTGKKIIGIPFHHRLMANIKEPRIWLSGEPEASFIPTPATHPTIVFEERTGNKRGFALTMESDFARYVCAIRNIGDTAELYTSVLAIAPGTSQTLEFSLDAYQNDCYWTFINDLRKRWNLNNFTAERPLFLGFVPKKMPKGKEVEYLQQNFGHLGPIALSIKPWRSADRFLMLKDIYPRLPKDAPRTPGDSPDLDVEEYLTFKHWDEIDAYQKNCVDMIHKALPNAWVIQMTHPSMEAVYLPLEDRWPYADCAIRNFKGEIMHMPHYDRSHFKKHAGNNNWVMGYYVPYGGSKYYEKLINNIRRGMEIGFDGLYIDEFSFLFERIGYSRYTYDRWDGFSADLDNKGNVVRLKSDNAFASVSFQHAAVDLVLSKGKYFLGNLGTGARSLNSAPNMRFWESNTRVGWTHTYQVPMLLGHVNGDLKRTFEGAKEAINSSCLYSPFAKSAKFLPKDNFVVKQYPFTTVKLMRGGIVGRERLITLNSGEYEWPGTPDGSVAELFIYSSAGVQVNKGRTAKVENGKIKLQVPKNGMVIAELKKK